MEELVTFDRAAIERMRDSPNEFELLVREFKGHVFKIVGRYVPFESVDEVAQDVFVKVYRSLPSYRHDAPLEHWISKLAVRTCYDYWRSRKRWEKEVTLDQAQMDLVDSNRAILRHDEWVRREDAKEVLRWAMSKLSPANRMVVTLLHLDGYSEKESADILGWSVAKVKVRAFRARRLLEQALRKLFEERTV